MISSNPAVGAPIHSDAAFASERIFHAVTAAKMERSLQRSAERLFDGRIEDMYRIDMGIDLGTSNVCIYMRDKGIVINQPAVVAYQPKEKKIIAVGSKAKRMMGKTPEGIDVETPLSGGVISNYTLAERMIKAFVKNALKKRKIWGRPNICVCTPAGITEVERRAVEDAVGRTGAKQVFVLESSIAAAIGTGVDIMETVGHMVVDIGGGTTDIAVISMRGAVVSKSIKVAGDDFNDAIVKYMRKNHSLSIGERTAEDVKIKIGTCFRRPEVEKMEVKGRHIVKGLPTSIEVTSEEMEEALEDSTNSIVEAIHSVLERTPPELSADIADRGIVLTGGGSLLRGLEDLITDRTGITCMTAEDPMTAVAIGTGKYVEFISSFRSSIE